MAAPTFILHAHGIKNAVDQPTATLPPNMRLLFPGDPKTNYTFCSTPAFYKNMCNTMPKYVVEPGQTYVDIFISFDDPGDSVSTQKYPYGIYKCDNDNSDKIIYDLSKGIAWTDGTFRKNIQLSLIVAMLAADDNNSNKNLWFGTCQTLFTPNKYNLRRKYDADNKEIIRSTDPRAKLYVTNTGKELKGFYNEEEASLISNMYQYLISNGYSSHIDKAKESLSENDAILYTYFAVQNPTFSDQAIRAQINLLNEENKNKYYMEINKLKQGITHDDDEESAMDTDMDGGKRRKRQSKNNIKKRKQTRKTKNSKRKTKRIRAKVKH